jgi:hypothetical protein
MCVCGDIGQSRLVEPRNGDGMEIVIRIHLGTPCIIGMTECSRVFRTQSVKLFHASVVPVHREILQTKGYVT